MKNSTFQTGYESRFPMGSDFKLFRGMVQRGKEKKENSYLSYILQLYSHVPLAIVRYLKLQSLLGEFYQEVLKLPNPIKRIQILNKIYLACRCVDDVIDGDSPKSLSPELLKLYGTTAESHLRNESWDHNFVPDKYFAEAMELCRKISIDIKTQVLEIIISMKFDAERRATFLETGKRSPVSEEELRNHYYQLDISGTVGAMLILLDEKDSEENRRFIQPLGELMRIYYDVRDLKKEIIQGVVNISREEANQFNITPEQLQNWALSSTDLEHAPSEILLWAREKMKEAESLLETFQKNLEISGFKPLTKMFFEKQYIRHYKAFKTENIFLF